MELVCISHAFSRPEFIAILLRDMLEIRFYHCQGPGAHVKPDKWIASIADNFKLNM
jgi:hypothetical protein